MILGKGLYDKLPVALQTVAVNVVSRRNFSVKYGSHFLSWLETLAANETKSRDELLNDQQIALGKLLEYAVRHVPYYRDHKFPPDDFKAWPVLEKSTIIQQPKLFLSDAFPPRDLMELRTSGTTGTPLRVYFSKEYHQVEMAFRWRHKAWAGVPFLSRSAWISGHAAVPPGQKRPPYWRWDRREKRLLCSSYHLTKENLHTYIEAFHRYQPDFIHGYPSSVYLLAQAGGYSPKAVFTASETLLDFQREAIERAFGAKVFNWYGNSEMACNIVGCSAGYLHYRTDYGLLELIGGETMICTGLNNLAMPLIRYKVGDRALAKPGDCPCGVAFPLIERIEGRVEDYIRTPEGRLVGRLDHVFKDAEYVREAQIVQPEPDKIVLRIVRIPGYSEAEEAKVLSEVRRRLGQSIGVRFEYVETIERTAAGKFQFIVSHLSPEQLDLPGL